MAHRALAFVMKTITCWNTLYGHVPNIYIICRNNVGRTWWRWVSPPSFDQVVPRDDLRSRHRCDDEALAGCCDQDPLTNMVSASQICIDCAIIFVAQTQPRSSRHGEMFDLEKAPNSSTAGIFGAQDTNFTPLYLWLILRRLRTLVNS